MSTPVVSNRQHILIYANLRYLKVSLVLLSVCIAAYIWHQPIIAANGGTWLGYGLGGLSTLLMLILLWLGIRKRHYHSSWGTTQGWVSAHVYLGVSLVLISSLHAGFQFSWNIHTLAYALLMLVVASGLYGVFAYHYYPPRISQNRSGLDLDTILEEINQLNTECEQIAIESGNEVHQIIHHVIQTNGLGGTIWQQLRVKPLTQHLYWWQKPPPKPDAIVDENYDQTMYHIATQLMATEDKVVRKALRQLLELLGIRNALIHRLQRHIQQRALMKVWLYLHVPLSFALLAAVLVHIITVFLYW